MTFKGQNPHVRDGKPGGRLAERTLALVNIPSVSRAEAEAMAYVRSELPLEPVRSSDDVLFVTSRRESGRPLVLLAGHVDTVPAQDNLPGRIEDGAVIGLGASDMKGGVAVMLELADWALTGELELDLGFLFFTREELPADESPVPEFLATCPEALEAELVIVLEPTDNELHLGCVGNLSAELTFRGVSAHSARPWTGENAIHKAAAAVRPKQAWTPVAQFAEAGLDAVNLGPGATRYAHRADEQVATGELVRTFEALRLFASGRGTF